MKTRPSPKLAVDRCQKMEQLFRRLQSISHHPFPRSGWDSFAPFFFGQIKAAVQIENAILACRAIEMVEDAVTFAEKECYNSKYPMAEYRGFQEDGKGFGFVLMNLKHDMGEHRAGSTVSTMTLDRLIEQSSHA